MTIMTGAELFARMVSGYGISHLFFVPGIMRPALAAMEDLNVTRVMTHGETAAAYMADGYARASGRPGLCMAQAVGAANLAAGLRDAFLASSPVIAVTGGPSPESRYRHSYQQIEDLHMFDPVTKLNARVDTVQRMPDLFRQAARIATSGSPGPVHLEMRGLHAEVINDSADLDPLVEEQFTRIPAYRPEPEGAALQRAEKVLREARRPVIVAGGGVISSGAAAEVVRLAERLSIPVATSLNGKGTIPESHPLALGVVGTYGRWGANRAVAEADLVFFIGSKAGSHVTNNWKYPAPGTAVIQLDVDPAEIGRNYPVKVGIIGDAQVTLRRLLELAEPGTDRGEWCRRAQSLVDEWRAEVSVLAVSNDIPIRVERVCGEITEFLPDNAVLVGDTGHAGVWTGSVVELRKPSQRYIRCAGTLGWAFPASLGVKCALPDRPVLCFTGDGGFFYYISELETAVRMGINTVVLVNNNGALQQSRRGFDNAYGGKQRGKAHQMWVFQKTDFAKIAEDFGCFAARVERPEDLRGALQQAFAANRPAVIDVATDLDSVPPGPAR